MHFTYHESTWTVNETNVRANETSLSDHPYQRQQKHHLQRILLKSKQTFPSEVASLAYQTIPKEREECEVGADTGYLGEFEFEIRGSRRGKKREATRRATGSNSELNEMSLSARASEASISLTGQDIQELQQQQLQQEEEDEDHNDDRYTNYPHKLVSLSKIPEGTLCDFIIEKATKRKQQHESTRTRTDTNLFSPLYLNDTDDSKQVKCRCRLCSCCYYCYVCYGEKLMMITHNEAKGERNCEENYLRCEEKEEEEVECDCRWLKKNQHDMITSSHSKRKLDQRCHINEESTFYCEKGLRKEECKNEIGIAGEPLARSSSDSRSIKMSFPTLVAQNQEGTPEIGKLKPHSKSKGVSFRWTANKSEILLLLVELILIYNLITSTTSSSSPVLLVSAATNYWPLRAIAGRTNLHQHNLQQQQQQQQVASPLLRPHQLMIGQHYSNFSSIVPYSIVQDDYQSYDQGDMESEQQVISPQQQQQQQVNGAVPDELLVTGHNQDQQQQQQQQQKIATSLLTSHETRSDSGNTGLVVVPAGEKFQVTASEQDEQIAGSIARALLPLALDSNRLMLPQMQQMKSRFNQGCVGGTKCQFFAFCWMSGGSLGASCGLLMTCCVTPSRQEIQPGFYGPVVNDPYCGRSTSKINRIVGGTDASFGQFPWQAFVQVGGSRCGGALISSRHVVTAGHCVARSQHSPSSIKVTLGDYILNSDIESIPHEVFSVVEVLLHPNFRFTPQADRYDVAVLELDRTAAYKDNIKPICLPQKDAAFVGRMAYVAGWGALQAGSKLRPKVLQHVAVPVIENHVCESWHRRKGIDIRIYDEMMCAGYELGQRDACQGDSGGPLMLNQFGVWYLVGIVSAGYSCAKQYQPGIYHRVSSSSDWISSNIYQQGANR